MTKRILEKEQNDFKGVRKDDIDFLKGQIHILNEKVKKLSQNPRQVIYLDYTSEQTEGE